MSEDYKKFIMPTDDVLRQRLSPEQYAIAYEGGTEPPFQNAYFDNKAVGIYVDVISRYPLFGSFDKYDSGTGWPSFTHPLSGVVLEEVQDERFGMSRIEVISPSSGAHLGHVFDDGPKEAGGKRYCMNSAVLLFIPYAELEGRGYGEFLPLFEIKSN
jgi:methionine-R-sulfoxide reductase